MEEKRKQNIWEGREAKIKIIDLPSGSARLCVFCVPCRSADSGRVGYIAFRLRYAYSAECTYLNRPPR